MHTIYDMKLLKKKEMWLKTKFKSYLMKFFIASNKLHQWKNNIFKVIQKFCYLMDRNKAFSILCFENSIFTNFPKNCRNVLTHQQKENSVFEELQTA